MSRTGDSLNKSSDRAEDLFGGLGPDEGLRVVVPGFDPVADVGFECLDRAVVAAIQRGLASGANEAFTFGRFEKAIVHFHRNLNAALTG